MVKNINHKNFYGESKTEKVDISTSEIVETPIQFKETKAKIVDETDKMIVELHIDREDVLYGLNKSEQVEILERLGLSSLEISKLRLQKQRVNKILEFVKKKTN